MIKRALAILAVAVSAANAQCVMCFRTAAAQQIERARVMNIGIGIMLLPPVLILAGFLYLAYRRNLSFVEDSPESVEQDAILPPEMCAISVGDAGKSGGLPRADSICRPMARCIWPRFRD